MKVLALALVIAVASAEKLSVTEPPGYVIRAPAIPFTAEEERFSGNRGFQASLPAANVLSAAPAVAPAATYQGPRVPAVPSGPVGYSGAGVDGPQGPAQYNFGYSVNSNDPLGNVLDFGHQEDRDGAQTAGSYYVLLPDSRVMRVEYTADEFGFHPVVSFEGEAIYPAASSIVSQPGQLYAAPSRK